MCFLRMNYYIFSTLPLDVENIIIHAWSSEEIYLMYERLCVFMHESQYFLHAAA